MNNGVFTYDIFISFAENNKRLAKRFYSKLTEKGYKVFPDPALEYEKEDKGRALRHSDSLLLLSSVHSKACDEVWKNCRFFALYKKECNVFIFDATGVFGKFKPEYIPVKNWKTKDPISDINKQIEEIEKTISIGTNADNVMNNAIEGRKPNLLQTLRAKIIGTIMLISAIASLFWFIIDKAIPYLKDYFNTSIELEFNVKDRNNNNIKDTTIYNTTIDLYGLLTVNPEKYKNKVEWTFKEKDGKVEPIKIDSIKKASISGLYVATYKRMFREPVRDSLDLVFKDTIKVLTPKNPCEDKSVEISEKEKYKTIYEPLNLNNIDVKVDSFYIYNRYTKEWQTEKGEIISKAEKEGKHKYIVVLS